jgi:predicted pyridoxine 5'-phosphate oxidase superfamily flavin-nucleotide-binding protein
MSTIPSDVAFTPTVKAIQTAKGSRSAYARIESGDGWETTVTPELAEFIQRQDMFFLGTANADGQPYIQHRGGPAGFLKVLDPQTLAFADFFGNQQYITLGNLQDNPKAIIFLMDWLERIRIKIWGTARVVEDDPALLEKLAEPTYPGKVERAIVFTLTAWDRNCPQHIQRRFLQSMIAPVIDQLRQQVAALEKQVRGLGVEPVTTAS